MCGKASVVDLKWNDVYTWAKLTPPQGAMPPDPESRVNISPSRLRRKADAKSMIWETLPIVAPENGVYSPSEAIWPFLPPWSHGRLPYLKSGKLLSTANARLRQESPAFAPTYMPFFRKGGRVLVAVSWFYEFDARVRPQIPYAVFPLDRPFWLMAGLSSILGEEQAGACRSVAIITVEPNEVLRGVGHHRSPALLRTPEDCHAWLNGSEAEALSVLRPYPNESMGTERTPMEIKIPGNQSVALPAVFHNRGQHRTG